MGATAAKLSVVQSDGDGDGFGFDVTSKEAF